MNSVALIYPYFRTRSINEMLFPPLGAASIAAQFRLLGIEVHIIDCTFKTQKEVKRELCILKPEIIGIYSMITLSQNAINIAKLIKTEYPESLLVAGGPLPTLYPEQYSGLFDVVFRGESTLGFPCFCRDYFDLGRKKSDLEKLPLESYSGLYIQSGRLKIDNPAAHYSEKELRDFPIPDRSDFNHQAYQKTWLEFDGTKTTSLITSFGCPYACDFCSKPIFGDIYRTRDLDDIFEEIKQIKSFGYDHLWIADDNFTLRPQHLEGFCQKIINYEVTWSCLSRSSNISRDTATLMKRSGCRKVYLGLETGCQETLKLMNKQIDLEEAIQSVYLFQDVGIKVGAFFIVGYPGETINSIEETFKLSLSLPLDQISFNVPFPLPGSKLFERTKSVEVTRDWKIENEVTFVYGSDFDQGWLKRKIEQTMSEFAKKHGLNC